MTWSSDHGPQTTKAAHTRRERESLQAELADKVYQLWREADRRHDPLVWALLFWRSRHRGRELVNAAIALALEHFREFSGQPRTWAALELLQFRSLVIRLEIGPRWSDGRRELATITRTYYVDPHGDARFIEYAHP